MPNVPDEQIAKLEYALNGFDGCRVTLCVEVNHSQGVDIRCIFGETRVQAILPLRKEGVIDDEDIALACYLIQRGRKAWRHA
jgi:hypothetical protein